MNRHVSTLILVFLLVAFICSHTLAQYEEDRPGKISIRVGAYRPAGSTLRNEGNSTWKVLGVAYNLSLDEKGRPNTFVGLERSAVDEYRLDAQMTGITYNKIWYRDVRAVSNPDDDEPKIRGFYCGAGLGVYMLKEELREVWGSPSEDNSGTKLGISLTAGYNFSSNWFAEIRYNRMGKLATNVDFSGLGLFVGANQLF
ncbi:MAG: outer membrane beta-barrel protein [Armatimonadetes bacterium]|nr:outer membrane beta-barrel protein [Armatimonadota bacterium]